MKKIITIYVAIAIVIVVLLVGVVIKIQLRNSDDITLYSGTVLFEGYDMGLLTKVKLTVDDGKIPIKYQIEDGKIKYSFSYHDKDIHTIAIIAPKKITENTEEYSHRIRFLSNEGMSFEKFNIEISYLSNSKSKMKVTNVFKMKDTEKSKRNTKEKTFNMKKMQDTEIDFGA